MQGHLGGSAGEASDFGSGHGPRVLGWSPILDSLLSEGPASPSLCYYPCLCALSLFLSPCQINKQNLKKKEKGKKTH